MFVSTSNLYPNLRFHCPEKLQDQKPVKSKDQESVEIKDPKPTEIKTQKDTVNNADHRISFFRAVKEFFTPDRIRYLAKLIIWEILVVATSMLCISLMLSSTSVIADPRGMAHNGFLSEFIKYCKVNSIVGGVLSGIAKLFIIGSIINDFFNSPEYLLTKGTKKLTADLEQLKKKKELLEKELQKLHQELSYKYSKDPYYNYWQEQDLIRDKRNLLQEIKSKINTIEIALKKFSEKDANNNSLCHMSQNNNSIMSKTLA